MKKNIYINDKKYKILSDDNYIKNIGKKFEHDMVSLFKSLIKADDIVMDVGANIGMTSILFSDIAKEVISIEACTTTFDFLKRNIINNNCKNVSLINIGLGDDARESTITYSKDNRAGGFISDNISLLDHENEKIMINTMDNLFYNKGKINFIKIDVEGFEMEVIKGGKKIIERDKPIIVLELNHFCLNVFRNISVPVFFDFLNKIFPYVFAIDRNNLCIKNLHNPIEAYEVMYQHILEFRYPNIVVGFDSNLNNRLNDLLKFSKRNNKIVNKIKKKLIW